MKFCFNLNIKYEILIENTSYSEIMINNKTILIISNNMNNYEFTYFIMKM